MVTETTQRIKDFTDEDISTLMEAPRPAAPVLVRQETPRVDPMDMDTFAPAPERVAGVLARIGKSLVAFYDGLAGPPMSKRERISLYLESTEVARRIGPYV